MATNNTVRLIAYVMRLEYSPTGSVFAHRIDKRHYTAAKAVAYNAATIEAHCASFALDVSRDWNGSDTTPVHVMVDRDPTKRAPRGYDRRPRGFITNAPEGTIVFG